MQPTYYIADIYQTVEQEAFDIQGVSEVLVRFSFPPGYKHAHLLIEKEVQVSSYDPETLWNAIDGVSTDLPVRMIGDDPVLCGVERLLRYGAQRNSLKPKRKIYLNTCGFLDLQEEVEGIYIWSRPGLYPTPAMLDRAREIRAYWKSESDEFADNVRLLDEDVTARRERLFLVPRDVDHETITQTIRKSMEIGWRFFLPPVLTAPDSDSDFQNNQEAERIYHSRQRETLGLR